MQKLSERRLTDTPASVPQARGPVALRRSDAGAAGSHPRALNSAEGRRSVVGSSTPGNNPDAALTPRQRENGGFMLAFVLNRHGSPLMPCHPAKARTLLKQGKAEVVSRTPFTVRLLHGSSGYRQPVTLGVDAGYSSVGLSAVTQDREVYAAEVGLRTDIVKLNSERRQYRRARRHRRTWYRQPRFDNRRKAEGWLAPSIRNKLDTHVRAVERVCRLLPVTDIVVEVAAFDIQRIKDPSISGTAYQEGEQYGFANVRQYVLHRDSHACRHCKGKSKDKRLVIHHLASRQTGGDRPANLITLCVTCHDRHHRGEIALKAGRSGNGFRAETFMTTVRWMLMDRLKQIGFRVSATYGYITKLNREALGLPKSHVNDAFVIAGGSGQARLRQQFLVRQVRKCNRKLRKGDRSHIPNTAPRSVHGFQRYDKVRFKGRECFVFGRRASGHFDLRALDGTRLHASAKASTLTLLERAATLLVQRRPALLPAVETTGFPRRDKT